MILNLNPINSPMPGDFLAFSIQGAQRFARSVDVLGSEFRQDVARDRQNLHGLAACRCPAAGAPRGATVSYILAST